MNTRWKNITKQLSGRRNPWYRSLSRSGLSVYFICPHIYCRTSRKYITFIQIIKIQIPWKIINKEQVYVRYLCSSRLPPFPPLSCCYGIGWSLPSSVGLPSVTGKPSGYLSWAGYFSGDSGAIGFGFPRGEEDHPHLFRERFKGMSPEERQDFIRKRFDRFRDRPTAPETDEQGKSNE